MRFRFAPRDCTAVWRKSDDERSRWVPRLRWTQVGVSDRKKHAEVRSLRQRWSLDLTFIVDVVTVYPEFRCIAPKNVRAAELRPSDSAISSVSLPYHRISRKTPFLTYEPVAQLFAGGGGLIKRVSPRVVPVGSRAVPDSASDL